MNDPDARVYRGEFENGRPHVLVVLREQGTDKARVLYAYGKRSDRDREGCRRARGRFDGDILTVRLSKTITVKYTFDGDQVAVEYTRVRILTGDLTAEKN